MRIGVALSDPEQRLSVPAENYTRGDPAQDKRFFEKLVAEERVVGFVVGLPLHMSGDESEKSRESREFGAWLAEQTGLPVTFHDERYSSALADDLMDQAQVRKKKKRRQSRDALAAHVILTGYLDWRRGRAAAAKLGES